MINNCIVFRLCLSTVYDESGNDIDYLASIYATTGVTVVYSSIISVVPLN